MTKLEMLFDYAYSNNIEVYEFKHDSTIKGYCMGDGEYSAIALNNAAISNSLEKTGVLSEELGHIETGSHLPLEDYLVPEFKEWLKLKNEIRAKKWAFEKAAPLSEIVLAIKKGLQYYEEIAYELDVDTKFLIQAIEYYRSKGLIE